MTEAPSPARPAAGLRWLLCAALAVGTTAAAAKDAERLRTRALAATCAHCHGTDGHAVEGEALIRLAGLPGDYILTQLLAFRTGDRKATVMHQITRGYSEQQLEQVAKYFAAQK